MKQADYLVPLALILLLLLLLGGGWGSYYVLKQGADSLAILAESLQDQVYREDWAAASETYAEIDRAWQNMSEYWPMLTHHQEMDRIEENLCKLEIYLQYEEADDAQAELQTLIMYVRHIPLKESLTLQNLF